jgi:hypothetical protein
MSRLLKYAIFLTSAVVIGFYIVFGPLGLEDIASIPIQRETTVVPPTREAALTHVEPASKASIDEELDYMVAKRLGSLEGWRAFLAAHGSGAYAQSARAEVKQLLPAENASAAAGEVSNGPSADARAASEALGPLPPHKPTEVAALTPEALCKRDEDRLVRLRSSPSSEEAARLASELGCEKLRPQVLALMESSAAAAPASAAVLVSNDASSDAKSVNEPARAAAPLVPAPPARTNSSPSDSLLAGVCASQRAALDRLRKEPSAEEARLFWRDLKCERLRPQVRLLMESLNLTPDSSGSAAALGEAEAGDGAALDAPAGNGADPVACRRETAELDRLRATPDLADAKRFASMVTCDALKPQAARLLESLSE